MPLLLALFLLVSTTAEAAQTARVIDGDTLELDGERIGLWGIDAVEGDQICQRVGRPWRCGVDSARALEALVDGRELTCTEVDRDRYRRTVATCTVAGRNIGAAMVRQGWRWIFEGYSTGAYAAEQLEAEQAQRGLRSGLFRSAVGVARSEVTVRRGVRGGSASELPARPARHQPRL